MELSANNLARPRRLSNSSPKPVKKKTSPPKSAFSKYPVSQPLSPLKTSRPVSPLEPCLEEEVQDNPT